MGHKGRKGLKHQEQEVCDYSLGGYASGGVDMMGGGGMLSGYGLTSGTGYYTINIGGNCVDVHESELKASKKKSGRFSCFIGGQKQKLRLSQIQASVNGGANINMGGNVNVSNLGANSNMNTMNISGGNMSGGGAGCNIVQSMEHVTVCDNDVLRVRSATPAAQCGAIEYIHQVNAVSTRPSPIAFYPYFKVKIGDTVRVLPYHIVSQGKASRRFFRFKYDGKTITVRKSAIRPVRKEYRVILDGRVMDVSASSIQPYGDNAYLVIHNGVERIVGAASVHSGVQDGAELITDDEADGRATNGLFLSRPGSAGPGSDGQSMGSRGGASDRVFGLKKKYIKKRGGKRIRRQPRRKPKSKKDLKIFDVSFCLCYQIILNGAHIVIPQHRMKQSKRHPGYMRFRYNKMVYYITPQTITQAFYAPVVGYYSIVVDEKVIVVSGREMEKHPEKEDTYIIRHGGDISEVHSTNISFLGEYVLEPDREQLTDEGESTAVSSDESCTSDSDASVSGRDEIVEDANVYTSRTFQIRRRCVATCYRVRVNGSEMVVPVSQVQPCKTRPGMLRVTYYGKTYFISQDDIELQYETEVTGFYSVTINGNPVILTGDDIEDHPSEGTYVCFYKNSRYVLAQTQIMYLGEYPVIQAPSYAETEVESSDTESEDDQASNVSEEEPQMCIFVNEKPNMDMTLPEPTSGSVMGWKVYIDGRFYTVPANRLKQLRNAPGFMEIIVNRKLYHVSIENIQPIMLPTVYFITIQNKPILVPAKDVRRHPTQEGYVIVRYRGQDYVIAVGELKLADGTAVSIDDIALDQEYRVTRTTRTTRRIRKERVKSPRTCSPLCDKVALMDDPDTVEDWAGIGTGGQGVSGPGGMGGPGGYGGAGGAGGYGPGAGGMGGAGYGPGAGGMGMGPGGMGMGMGAGGMGMGNGMGMGVGAGGMGMGGGNGLGGGCALASGMGGGNGISMGAGNGMGVGMGVGMGIGGGNGMVIGGANGMGLSGGNGMGISMGGGNAMGLGGGISLTGGNCGISMSGGHGHGGNKSRSGSKGRHSHQSSSSSDSSDDGKKRRH